MPKKRYGSVVAVRLTAEQQIALDSLFDSRIPRSTLIREAIDLMIARQKEKRDGGFVVSN